MTKRRYPLAGGRQAGVGGTGVVGAVGVLVNGDGPVVMARADVDARPVRERTGLPHRLPRRDVPVDHSPFSDPASGSCRAPASAPGPSPPWPGPGA